MNHEAIGEQQILEDANKVTQASQETADNDELVNDLAEKIAERLATDESRDEEPRESDALARERPTKNHDHEPVGQAVTEREIERPRKGEARKGAIIEKSTRDADDSLPRVPEMPRSRIIKNDPGECVEWRNSTYERAGDEEKPGDKRGVDKGGSDAKETMNQGDEAAGDAGAKGGIENEKKKAEIEKKIKDWGFRDVRDAKSNDYPPDYKMIFAPRGSGKRVHVTKAELRKRLEHNSTESVAAEMGCNPMTIIRQCRTVGLVLEKGNVAGFHPPSKQVLEEVLGLAGSAAKLAKVVGVSGQTVQRACQEWGVDLQAFSGTPGQAWQPTKEKLSRDYIKEKKSVRTIAKEQHVDDRTVKRRLASIGVNPAKKSLRLVPNLEASDLTNNDEIIDETSKKLGLVDDAEKIIKYISPSDRLSEEEIANANNEFDEFNITNSSKKKLRQEYRERESNSTNPRPQKIIKNPLFEKEEIVEALQDSTFIKAAEKLGTTRNILIKECRRLGIEHPKSRSSRGKKKDVTSEEQAISNYLDNNFLATNEEIKENLPAIPIGTIEYYKRKYNKSHLSIRIPEGSLEEKLVRKLANMDMDELKRDFARIKDGEPVSNFLEKYRMTYDEFLSILKSNRIQPRKVTIDYVKDKVAHITNDIEILSKDIQGVNSEVTIICNDGHKFKRKIHSLLSGHCFCPKCYELGNSKTERLVKFVVESTLGVPFEKSYPAFLRSEKDAPLEIDLYSEKLNLAIEVQGVQHFQQISGRQTEEEFRNLQKNDHIKRVEIPKHGIHRLEFVYTLKPDQYQDYLIRACNRFSIPVPKQSDNYRIKDFWHYELPYRFIFKDPLTRPENEPERGLFSYLNHVYAEKIPKAIFNDVNVNRASDARFVGIDQSTSNDIINNLMKNRKIDKISIKDTELSSIFSEFEEPDPKHEVILTEILKNDKATIAIEIPVWDIASNTTGHIDLLRIRKNEEGDTIIQIWDYKPEGERKFFKYIPQLLTYARLLRKSIGMQDDQIIECVIFDRMTIWKFDESIIREIPSESTKKVED